MASGLLTGAFDQARIDSLTDTDWRRESPAFQEPLVARPSLSSSACDRSPRSSATTLPALAVAWVLAQPGVTGAIVGARSSRHVDGWSPAAELEFDARTLEEIEKAIEATGAGSDSPPAPPPHVRAPVASE